MPRASDYPPPSYAGYVWAANGKFWLASAGRGTASFEDTPDGLNALRNALLALSVPQLTGGSNLPSKEVDKFASARRFDVRGKPKLSEGDFWSGVDAAIDEELAERPKEEKED